MDFFDHHAQDAVPHVEFEPSVSTEQEVARKQTPKAAGCQWKVKSKETQCYMAAYQRYIECYSQGLTSVNHAGSSKIFMIPTELMLKVLRCLATDREVVKERDGQTVFKRVLRMKQVCTDWNATLDYRNQSFWKEVLVSVFADEFKGNPSKYRNHFDFCKALYMQKCALCSKRGKHAFYDHFKIMVCKSCMKVNHVTEAEARKILNIPERENIRDNYTCQYIGGKSPRTMFIVGLLAEERNANTAYMGSGGVSWVFSKKGLV